MPFKSAAQKRLMMAAAHTKGGYGGVSQAVGEKFVAHDMSGPDWSKLGSLITKWLREEAAEPEHAEDDASPKRAAGILYVAPDGRVLLLKRAGVEGRDNYVGHWALPGGGVNADEQPIDGAAREAREESGHDANIGEMRLIDRTTTPSGMEFHTFRHDVDAPFDPKLNDEHSAHMWASPGELPEPMHPAVEKLLKSGVVNDCNAMDAIAHDPSNGQFTSNGGGSAAEKTKIGVGSLKSKLEAMPHAKLIAALKHPDVDAKIKKHIEKELDSRAERGTMRGHGEKTANDCIAMDRDSVRTKDEDGHLHVERAHISKACVNPYYGHEIPEADKLGLDPKKIYYLLRDPEELKNAASTFAGKPLLKGHTPAFAADHPADSVAGSVGHDIAFNHPYLDAPLTVWDGDAIDGIESDRQRELSSSYRYDADMTPGTFEGKPYDGVMRNIRGNHVALVETGRAGSDVLVGDEMPKGLSLNWSANQFANDAETKHDPSNGQFTSSGGGSSSKTNKGKKVNPNPVPYKGHPLHDHDDAELKRIVESISQKVKSKDTDVHEKAALTNQQDKAIAILLHRQKIGGKQKDHPVKDENIKQANDSKENIMSKHKPALSRHADYVRGALTVYLGPKLAKDAKIDLVSVLKGTTARNFKTVRPTVVLDIKKALNGKLARDASLDDVNLLLDKLEPSKEAMDEEELDEKMPMSHKDKAEEAEDDDVDSMSFDDDREAELREMLEGKHEPEEIERICAMMKPKAAEDEPPQFKEMPEVGGKTAKDGEEEKDKMKGMVSKPAMDAALKKNRDETIAEMRRQFADRTEAQNLVRPLIGEVTVAMDTAAKILTAALDHAGVEHDGITDLKALRRLTEVVVKNVGDSERAATRRPRIATDSADKITEFNKKHGITHSTMRHI